MENYDKFLINRDNNFKYIMFMGEYSCLFQQEYCLKRIL